MKMPKLTRAIRKPPRLFWVQVVPLLDSRPRRRGHARDFDLFAIDQIRNARGHICLPVVTLVDLFVEPLTLGLAFKATDPDKRVRVAFADPTGDDVHAFGCLEGNDLVLGETHPIVALAGPCGVLPELEEHAPFVADSSV